MKQFFGNKYVKGITQFIQDEHFGPRDYIDWYCEQMGLSREEYMAGYRIAMDLRLARVQESEERDWNDPKPGPDPYDRGLDDEEIEDKEEQMKKQAKMDDDDPDAYKEMPGDKEAREKGKVKTSKHVKSYHELYGDEKNEALITTDDQAYLNQITSFLKKYKNERGLNNDKKFTAEVIKILKQRVSDRDGLVKKRFQKILKNVEKDFKAGNYLKLNESLIVEEKAEGDRGPIDNPDIETALKKKKEETGVPMEFLRIIMRRGMAAWKTGHRPGANQQQWGYARVNSFLTKQEGTWGGADADVAKEVRDGGHDKNLKKG